MIARTHKELHDKNGYYILEDTTLGKGVNPSFPRISCAFDVVVCGLNCVYIYIYTNQLNDNLVGHLGIFAEMC